MEKNMAEARRLDFEIPWHNMRRHRAEALTAHIMRVIEPFITDHENNAYRHASEALLKTFYDAGAEVITDMDRAAAGLRPRNDLGYTAEELQILELRRRDAMLRPVSHVIFPGDKLGQP